MEGNGRENSSKGQVMQVNSKPEHDTVYHLFEDTQRKAHSGLFDPVAMVQSRTTGLNFCFSVINAVRHDFLVLCP
jgi:hypothetical protein